MSKTRTDKAYEQGFESGKEGGFLDDLAQSFNRGWGTSDQSKAYYDGYEEGARRRGIDDESNVPKKQERARRARARLQ